MASLVILTPLGSPVEPLVYKMQAMSDLTTGKLDAFPNSPPTISEILMIAASPAKDSPRA